MKKLIAAILLFTSITAVSQTTTIYRTFGSPGWNAFVTYPSNMNDAGNTKRYPLQIFIPGLGEVGSTPADTTKLKTYGPHGYIRSGAWNGQVNDTSGNNKECIIVSLQPASQWPGVASWYNRFIEIRNAYRVDTNAFTATGLSHGSWGIGEVLRVYPWLLKAVVPASFELPTDQTARIYGQSGKYWWSFCGNGDSRIGNMRRNRDTIVLNAGTSTRTVLTEYSAGHTGWNQYVYDPSLRYTVFGKSLSPYMFLATYRAPGATDYWTSVTAVAGPDQYVAKRFLSDPDTIYLDGRNSSLATSYSWSKIAGQTCTIVNGNTATPYVLSSNQEGYISFELSVNGGASKDTVVVWVRDMMKKNVTQRPHRAKRKYTLGNANTQGATNLRTFGVSAEEIYYPYWNRNASSADSILAGDTLEIAANTTNNGYWERITLGDFGGNINDSVIVVPGPGFKVGPPYGTFDNQSYYVKFGTGSNPPLALSDSNVINYVKFDGQWRRNGNQNVYGWDLTTAGWYIELGYNYRLTGLQSRNAGSSAVQTKIISGTGAFRNKWRLYENTRMRQKLDNMYVFKSGDEALYIGDTNAEGGKQALNDFPVPFYDSLWVENIIADSSGKDGIQIATARGYTIVRNNLILNSATQQNGSHAYTIFLGGLSNGTIDSNYMRGGSGPMGALGEQSIIRHNIHDMGGNKTVSLEGSFYANSSTGGTGSPYLNAWLQPPLDSARVFLDNNIFMGFNKAPGYKYIIRKGEATNRMRRGSVRNNYFVDPVLNQSQILNNNVAGDTVTGNRVLTGINLDTSFLKDIKPYRLYKDVYLSKTPGTPISFYDQASANQSPTVSAAASPSPVLLPASTTVLNAQGFDSDGTIANYTWTQVSGPSQAGGISPNLQTVTATGLVEGTYVFRITVTDDDNATAATEVTVVVRTPANIPPKAEAGDNITVGLRTPFVTLDGTDSDDEDGTIVGYLWEIISGPGSAVINNPNASMTTMTSLVQGTYRVRLTVTDDKGDTNFEEILVRITRPVNVYKLTFGRKP